MNYISTRDAKKEKTKFTAAEAICRGIAPDGGLFFPEDDVYFTKQEIELLSGMDYGKRAATVLQKYLTDFTFSELLSYCRAAYYPDRFPLSPAKVKNVGKYAFLELFNGPTCAFKDLALQLMPRLLSASVEKTNKKGTALILVATSGDTGKAALEGFADVDRTAITVFYPNGGVSEIQEKQMCTQKGKNVKTVAVNGNFDDCQTKVKEIFTDENCRKAIEDKGYFFSSANSINFGRLCPQVAYYFSATTDMFLKDNEKAAVIVPTGNFGNILAAYMAKRAGAPIGKLICASNKNNVLTDFFRTGVYDKRREFYLTSSPSMDILVSSNLERLIFLVCGAEKTSKYMADLKQNGIFKVDDDELKIFRRDFEAYYADEAECEKAIYDTWTENRYLIDTHTAVAVSVAEKYEKDHPNFDGEKPLIVSTASPYKFAPSVCKALGLEKLSGFAAADLLSQKTGTEIPTPLSSCRKLQSKKNVCEISEMFDNIF